MSNTISELLKLLPDIHDHHSPNNNLYLFLKQLVLDKVSNIFGPETSEPQEFGDFGKLLFPFHSMGSVTSTNLFDLDELILFSFYWRNRSLYKKVVDIGANIGLHSILMNRCGFIVTSYEPDPEHIKILEKNIKLNDCQNISVRSAAVSDRSEKAEFVRLLNNTTGSHIAGAKAHPYGPMQTFLVDLISSEKVVEGADLLKIDAEGHENKIITSIPYEFWSKSDALVEVGSENNSAEIFSHFQNVEVNLYAQNLNWGRISDASQMPTSYRDGSLFISTRDEMPW